MLLESKADRWHARRVALVESIQNLATFYKALQALPRSTSTADLSEWFEHLIDQVRHHYGLKLRAVLCLVHTRNVAQHDVTRNMLRMRTSMSAVDWMMGELSSTSCSRASRFLALFRQRSEVRTS